jgi:TatD DNase family protein
VAASTPADRLLVETDSPFLAPPGAPRGRNAPEYVRITAAWLADRRGIAPDALGMSLVEAYDRSFPRLTARPSVR